MEHIGGILARLRSQGTTPDPTNFDSEREPTVEERKEKLRRDLNITSWDNTFENFKRVKGVEDLLDAFKELASGKALWHMLLCYGFAGCGKTHLCEALSIEIGSRVWEWAEVIREFKRRMHSENKGDYDNFFEMFRSQSRLIIDDVGMGSTGSSWEWGELEDIINYRYREGLMTVVTTNLDIKELPDRVTSRFRDREKARCILITAKDYRPMKGIQRS